MLALRLTRGAHPLAQCRRLLLAGAAAGVGFLLLSVLGYALAHPDQGCRAALRMAWCVLPLAATVHLAAAVAHTDPTARGRAGFGAAGLGPAGLSVLGAVSTAVAALLGSTLALLTFLHLRGDISGLPFDGAAGRALGASRPLPVAGTLTLLAVVPLAAAAAGALAARPRRERGRAVPQAPPPMPGSAVWGTALAVAGFALAAGTAQSDEVGDGLASVSAGVTAGWLLTAAGAVLATPGLTRLSGLLLAARRPGPLRLLSGRALQEDAARLGMPLGTLCTTVAALLCAQQLGGLRLFGPMTLLGTAVVVACALGTTATAAAETRAARRETVTTLRQLGTSPSQLRRAAALHTAALLAVAAPLTWLTSHLLSFPVTP